MAACPPSYPILCPNGTCGATAADCASAAGSQPAGPGGQDTGNQPGLPAYQAPPGVCQAFGVKLCQSNTGVLVPVPAGMRCPGTSTELPANASECPTGGLSGILGALSNPTFWKFTGLIMAGALAVLVGAVIWLKED